MEANKQPIEQQSMVVVHYNKPPYTLYRTSEQMAALQNIEAANSTLGGEDA